MLRLLGILFLLALILAAIGYWRGWFTVRTAEAGAHDRIQVDVDRDRMDRDTSRAVDRIGELSSEAWERLRRLGRSGADRTHEIEARVTAIDLTRDHFTLQTDAGERIELTIPTNVPISAAGLPITPRQLRLQDRVLVVAEGDPQTGRLVRLEVLR